MNLSVEKAPPNVTQLVRVGSRVFAAISGRQQASRLESGRVRIS